LGLSRGEVEARFNDIVDFADIGDFIEQPVKTYSSGMVVRLAFSVAINAEPQILVVDEALSVGDELFQRKCFSRIESIRSAGATILFVSHSGGTVVELCDRAILLDQGENLVIDSPKKVVGLYQKLLYCPAEKRQLLRKAIIINNIVDTEMTYVSDYVRDSVSSSPVLEVNDLQDSYDPTLKPTSTIEYESRGVLIENPTIYSLAGEVVNNITRGKSYIYRYRVKFFQPSRNVKFGMLIKTTLGVELGGAASALKDQHSIHFISAGSQYSVEFQFNCRLNAGVYFLNAGVLGNVNGSETYLHRIIDAAMFRVTAENSTLNTGVIDFSCSPRVEFEGEMHG
jgi:lipopolysaccharide transport system ATP-binding protein